MDVELKTININLINDFMKLSESKIEEIIAGLWTIVWAVLWSANAPSWMLWLFGIKAGFDFLCVLGCGIKEVLEERK